ncbi:MAG: helix-turn-helix transcriptional regulator [Anaerolineales bacterium]|nr:helix-turn-helix transcriptional regulator [Anaerolineales bacterium]
MLFETEKPPNKYTRAMGELIRKAREEAGLSQEQLAEKVYRKRLAVSEMENGKVEISAWTLPLLSAALQKPITYFFPQFVLRNLPPEKLAPLEQELLIHFDNLWDEVIQKVAINLIKTLSEYDPVEMLIEAKEHAEEELEFREQIETAKKKK